LIVADAGAADQLGPVQSRKITARLQAANSSDRPILLRTTVSGGYGIGTTLDEEIQ
jgi:prolyl oligopeptidase